MVQYDPAVEHAIAGVCRGLRGSYPLSPRAVAVLLLAGDRDIEALVRIGEGNRSEEILALAQGAVQQGRLPIASRLAASRAAAARRLLEGVVNEEGSRKVTVGERLSRAMISPATGIPLLILTLAGLYLFVGVLGAQVLVGWLEEGIFGRLVNPAIVRLVEAVVPWQAGRDLLAGPYGVLTLGLRYSVAIILPIVGTFFLAFSLIEDSGYLPRLAMLIDHLFKRIGLNGRAVIPMVLGFGCDTMATLVTRTLESRRERAIATLLLALAIPCSAQLGVILAMLAPHPGGLAIWIAVVAGVFLLVGFLAAQLMPGERPAFSIEFPPLRVPRLANVAVKTLTRMEWYLREVIPVFLLASLLIWLGEMTGVFPWMLEVLRGPIEALGLPEEAAVSFLFGFFRRDYGAAGLYDLRSQMTGVQVTVAAVTLTLFLPCIAQFSVMWKERGWKSALAIAAFIFPFAFLVGWLLSQALVGLGVTL
jgi:ferrous iron transport protein B